MSATVLESVLRLHLAHRHTRRHHDQARILIYKTIDAIRRARGI